MLLPEKTVEGTAAGITSVLAACSILLPLLASTGYIFTEVWVSFFLYSGMKTDMHMITLAFMHESMRSFESSDTSYVFCLCKSRKSQTKIWEYILYVSFLFVLLVIMQLLMSFNSNFAALVLADSSSDCE